MSVQPGTLYCVATPIGNLKDITFRAVEILNRVDLILAEDTRHSGKLLNHYHIATKMKPMHDHNERQVTEQIVQMLQQGMCLALISDAGTPLVSDPGFFLVRACIEAGVQVVSIPGPCAAISALAAAGLPTDQFSFMGFLPAKGQARAEALEQALTKTETLVFYESGRRLETFLQIMVDSDSAERQVVLAHELTKTYESYYRGTAAALLQDLQAQKISTKGEWVICVAGNVEDQSDAAQAQRVQLLLEKLLPHYSVSETVKFIVQLTGAKKKWVYEQALAIKS